MLNKMSMARTTNVKPADLNYDRYSMQKYDRDIINSIPYHKELHTVMAKYVKRHYQKGRQLSILDLGVGTGLTSRVLQNLLPNAKFDVIDFSKQMLVGAKAKLGTKNVQYLYGDYASYKFNKQYDIIVAVIGVHHQTHAGKRKLFKKIYKLLKQGGIFIFGDLVTYTDKYTAAFNQALHFHHLVKHATNTKTLAEWAHHYMFLNDLAPIEDQFEWLTQVGFKTSVLFQKMNTALLMCKK